MGPRMMCEPSKRISATGTPDAASGDAQRSTRETRGAAMGCSADHRLTPKPRACAMRFGSRYPWAAQGPLVPWEKIQESRTPLKVKPEDVGTVAWDVGTAPASSMMIPQEVGTGAALIVIAHELGSAMTWHQGFGPLNSGTNPPWGPRRGFPFGTACSTITRTTAPPPSRQLPAVKETCAGSAGACGSALRNPVKNRVPTPRGSSTEAAKRVQ